MKQKITRFLMLLLFLIPVVSGEVVEAEQAEMYLESIFILKTLGQLVVTLVAGYFILMDIPISSIITSDDDQSSEDHSSRMVHTFQTITVLAVLVGVIELAGKLLASLMGITIPGA